MIFYNIYQKVIKNLYNCIISHRDITSCIHFWAVKIVFFRGKCQINRGIQCAKPSSVVDAVILSLRISCRDVAVNCGRILIGLWCNMSTCVIVYRTNFFAILLKRITNLGNLFKLKTTLYKRQFIVKSDITKYLQRFFYFPNS